MVRHAVLLAVVLEMNQVGLSPERAVKLSMANLERIQRAAFLVASKRLSDDDEPLLIAFDPVALSDLRESGFWDETEATFDIVTDSEFKDQLGGDANGKWRRYALINVTEVLGELCHRLDEVAKVNEDKLRKEILRSADEDDWRDGNP